MRIGHLPLTIALVVTAATTGIAWAGEVTTFPWTDAAAKAAAAAAAPAPEPAAKDKPTNATDAAPDGSDPKAATATAKADGATPAPETPAPASGEKGQSPPADKTKAPAPVAAKKLFGAMKSPANMKARAIGAYSRGCLAGATALSIDGPAWQAMRLSRNRNWGHPKLIAMLEKYAGEVKAKDGWPGLLVGDISQPRGGPMLTGHASHQLGLDADIWFTPMPSRRLSKTERENLAATSMLAPDNLSVNKKVWGEGQVNIVRRVASYPEVERVLVHPAIKKALCEAGGTNRGWLAKVRPYWGHFYHYHVRIGCPADSPTCTKQAPIPGDDGCGKELDDWFKLLTAPPKPKPRTVQPAKPVKPKPPLTLADLPAECQTVADDDDDDAVVKSAAPKKPPAAKPVKAATTPAKKTKSADAN
jgi:penicillin-insensitive murein endopeptidase